MRFSSPPIIDSAATPGLTYFLTDHLGSTALTTDSTGAKLAEMRYRPWGEPRYTNGTALPKYTFTSQRSEMDSLGLMFYNARWFDPSLGRFAQADTLVPGGTQAWDRYAYVNNNPVRYNDPTGHMIDQGDDGGCTNPVNGRCPTTSTSTTTIGPAPYTTSLAGYSSSTAPYSTTNYSQQAEESTCYNCSVEPGAISLFTDVTQP